MTLNNLEEEKLATEKLNELQALFVPILSALTEDQRQTLAKIDNNLFKENEDKFLGGNKKEEDLLFNNLFQVKLEHVDRNENPWFDNDICY